MEFKKHLEKYLSKDEIEKLMEAVANAPIRALLLNLYKMRVCDLLAEYPFLKPHPIVKNGYLFNPKEHELGKSIHHFQGCFYIQEPSAMVPAYLLNAEHTDYVLDLCAAPGGKTVQTSLLMQNLGVLVANDISRSRINAVLENVERMGLANVVITNNDFSKLKHFYKDYFTKIILDAPCSGSGMFRKDNKMIEDWSYNKVLKFAEEQKKLILYAYEMLAPGGTMCYSTCSFSFEENEEVIEYLLENTDAELVEIKKNNLFYVDKQKPYGIHLFPHIFNGDGQYVCLIKKPGELTLKKIKREDNPVMNNLRKYIPVESYQLRSIKRFGDYLFALPLDFKYSNDMNIIRYGLKIGEIKNVSTIIYDHHFSHYLQNFPLEVELDEENLKKYMKGETLNIEKDKNFVLVKYQNIPLGFAKSDGRILKNHLPKGLRR